MGGKRFRAPLRGSNRRRKKKKHDVQGFSELEGKTKIWSKGEAGLFCQQMGGLQRVPGDFELPQTPLQHERNEVRLIWKGAGKSKLHSMT